MSESQHVHRVLHVHTRYRQARGEDEAVEGERRLLEHAGVDVRQVVFDNADLRESQSLASDLRLAASASRFRGETHLAALLETYGSVVQTIHSRR